MDAMHITVELIFLMFFVSANRDQIVAQGPDTVSTPIPYSVPPTGNHSGPLPFGLVAFPRTAVAIYSTVYSSKGNMLRAVSTVHTPSASYARQG